MRPTSEKTPIPGEKFVRPPVKRRSGMGAMIDVGKVAALHIDNEAFDHALLPVNLKFR